MNDLQIFNSEQFGKIRAVEVDGEPWFCLADICNPLRLRATRCRERLKAEEVLPALRRTGTYTVPPAVPKRIPEVSPSGLAKLIAVTRQVMLDMGNSPVEIGAMTKSVLETWGIPIPVAFSNQIPGQLCLFDHPVLVT